MIQVLATFFALCVLPLIAGEKTFVLTNTGKYRNQAQFTSSAPLETIVGTADKLSGRYTLDVEQFQRADGEISVEVRSMRTGNTTRDGHMYGPDWLDAQRYPTITYRLKRLDNPSITRDAERIVVKAKAVGEFTLHGVTRELQADVTITYLSASERTRSIASGDLVLVQASFAVPLKDFNIRGKGTIVGSRVGEVVTVEVTLFGVAQ